MGYYEVVSQDGSTTRTQLVYGDTPEGAIRTARALMLRGTITKVRRLEVFGTTHYGMSATSRWAVEHNHQVHPALKQALEEAKPLIEDGLWGLAVGMAFDAGVAARDLVEAPEEK